MKTKSITKNAILNVIRVFVTIVFPLITFPYATRVLGTENIGKVQFSSSIIIFFLLIAALGINSYAVREGASLRNDRKKISDFASDVFSINIIFTFTSYILLFLLLLLPTKINTYFLLIIIQSIQLVFTTIGVDWVYVIYEDYLYITIRTIIVQIISLVLLFIFVHKPDDYYIYTLIIVLSASGVNVLNFFHSKKYVDLRIKKDNNFKKNIKPMLVLFSNDLAQQVYINSDSLMLGFMTSDYNVGIYSVSVKIYTIIKKLLNAIIAVTIPRMAYYNSHDKNKFSQLCSNIFNFSILVLLPVIVLLFLLSDNIVLLLFGTQYLDSINLVKILSIGLLFAVFANLFCNGILIIKKEEKHVLRATLLAATANVLLNIVFIDKLHEIGAAITTVIAEFIVMTYTFIKAKKFFDMKTSIYNIITEIIGCLFIVLVYLLFINLDVTNDILFMLLVGTIGIVIYILILILFRNSSFTNLISRKKK